MNSNQKKKKKTLIATKQKETMDRLLNKYDFRTNHLIKQFKSNKYDTRTPRLNDRLLNVKISSHKKSNVNIAAKSKPIQSASNSSFCLKNPPKCTKGDIKRKRSSSSSPDIRTTPNTVNMSKKLSKNDFGYVNPKRKSYNNPAQIKANCEVKNQLPTKTTQASIKSSILGSGRSSVMSTLAKAATKYRNVKQSSQSFIDTLMAREFANNSIDLIHGTTKVSCLFCIAWC